MLDDFLKTNRDEVIARTRSKVAERAAPRPTQEELTSGIPGLYLAGNAYHGIGIPDCVRTGQEAATKIISVYRPEPQPA